MSRKIEFRPAPRMELEEAVAWYERQRPGLGAELDVELHSVLEQIRNTPGRFAKVTSRVRKARLKRFRVYSIYFIESDAIIRVIAVWHGKRDPE